MQGKKIILLVMLTFSILSVAFLYDPLASEITNPFDVIHSLTGCCSAVHHIISAYYDSRDLPNRPAVVMFGYVEGWPEVDIYCTLLYEDNSTKCVGKVLKIPLNTSDTKSRTYICRMSSNETIPTHVILNRGKCGSSEESQRIPVYNRDKITGKENIGVCIEGPLFTSERITHEDIFEMLVEFLAMVKVLGVNIVTVYNMNTKQELLLQIQKLYPEFVDAVQWKKLTGVLRYHGQDILLQDCLYRNMNKVKYLAFIDLDEMIFPTSYNTWMDMLDHLENEGKYASYTFPNNFFPITAKAATIVGNDSCQYLKSPKYFVRLNRLPWPESRHAQRMKVIVKPDILSAMCVHLICGETVRGYHTTYWVPQTVGLMAHYRVKMEKCMIYGEEVEDTIALKYKDMVMQEMKRVCSLLDI